MGNKFEETQARSQVQPQAQPHAEPERGMELLVHAPLTLYAWGGLAVDLALTTAGMWLWMGQNPGWQLGDFVAALGGWLWGKGLLAGVLFWAALVVAHVLHPVIERWLTTYGTAKAERINTAALEENKALRQQIAELRRALEQAGGKQAANKYETQNNAFRMLGIRLLENRSISRDACAEYGIGQLPWKRAMSLLQNAGVLDRSDKPLITDYPTAVMALQRYLLTSRSRVLAADGDWSVS